MHINFSKAALYASASLDLASLSSCLDVLPAKSLFKELFSARGSGTGFMSTPDLNAVFLSEFFRYHDTTLLRYPDKHFIHDHE
jgi:hypothetical protein